MAKINKVVEICDCEVSNFCREVQFLNLIISGDSVIINLKCNFFKTVEDKKEYSKGLLSNGINIQVIYGKELGCIEKDVITSTTLEKPKFDLFLEIFQKDGLNGVINSCVKQIESEPSKLKPNEY